jgi:SAM-dependent methyltransferase
MMQQANHRAGGDYDYDYDAKGAGYAAQRRADPRIAAQIWDSLGDACSVLNVGAGTGNYEPLDRMVVALEPSAAMRAERPAHAAPCVIGVAEALPFDDHSFDAVMSVLSCHQWADKPKGLAELRRVARGPVVVLTFDPVALQESWLTIYMADIAAAEAARFLPIETLSAHLGGEVEVRPCRVPQNCTDGFMEAFFGRPEHFLDPQKRAAQSAWAFAPAGAEARFVAKLAADLASGAWDARYGHLRTAPFFDGSLRLLIGR